MSNITNSEDTNVLYAILETLNVMNSKAGFQDTAGNQRVSGSVVVSGSVTSSTTIATLTNQVNIGSWIASMQVPSTMNLNAQNLYALIARS